MVGVTAQSSGHIGIVLEHVSGDVQRVVNVTEFPKEELRRSKDQIHIMDYNL